ncbi:MAG: hypothetical protein HN380_29805 [Victivallales bacterium]|nr:hypothetical protein [Victivallales bacterium]
MMMSAGKGDRPRPVDKAQYDSNYERISWGKSPRRETEKTEQNQPPTR